MNRLLQKLLVSGSAFAIGAVVPAGVAIAQDQDIEQVVVSASRVTIAGYTQPTPVTVVGAAQLQQDAFANIEDSVRELPQVVAPPTSFGAFQTAAGAGNAGTNEISLRNLGFARTLVLLDGQRVVSSSLSQGGVDTTTFPQALISRVDVVTGGASAAWGSDAVAGVVNFVLDKNYTGFKATLQGSDTTGGLDRGLLGNAAWGDDVAGDRGHIEFSVSADLMPDTVMLTQENWYKGTFFVSNPAYGPSNGQPQLIVASNVGLANESVGGLITASPAGVAGAGVTPAAANSLRGIQFVGNGEPELVNFGNLTAGSLSNGGSLTDRDSEAPNATITNPSNTYSFFGLGRYKLTDTVQASLQLDASYYTGKAGLTPTTQSVTIKSDNAYIPASVRAAMQAGGIASFTMGVIDTNNFNNDTITGSTFFAQAEPSLLGTQFLRRNLDRGVFSLDGTLGDDWSWSAYAEDSQLRQNEHTLGNIITPNLTAAEDAVTVTTANRGTSGLPVGAIACRSTLTGASVTSGSGVDIVTAQPGCVPLDVFGTGVASPAAVEYVTGESNGTTDFAHTELQQQVIEGTIQGTLPWELPAGKVAVAFGMGYRKESAFVNSSAIASAGGYAGANFVNFPVSSYNVMEGFAEVDAPILKDNIVNSLDLSMAGRITSYSTSGLVETWKLGATSQINDDIKLRSTLSVDIRAPQLQDLYAPQGFGVQTVVDPRSQQTVQIFTETGGNPNLLPEVAHTFSGGVVLTPTFIPSLSLSADWYHINVTGFIGTPSYSLVAQQCNAQKASPLYPGQNGNPNDPLCSRLVFNGPGGALSAILLGEQNFSSQTTSGLDLAANYTMDFMDGTLSFVSTDNYTDEDTYTAPGQGSDDFAGSNTGNIGNSYPPGPKWKGIVSATYATGPYSVTAQTRWFGTSVVTQIGNTGNESSAAIANLYDPAHFEVPAIAYLDLRGNYKWNDNISFYGAIDNALDLPPPLVPGIAGNVSVGSTAFYNTNQYLYDMLGRSIRVGVRFNY